LTEETLSARRIACSCYFRNVPSVIMIVFMSLIFC
jgi:hypothetical protein